MTGTPVPRPCAAAAMALGLLIGCGGADPDKDTTGASWRIPDQALGLPLASGQDAAFGDGTDVWLAAAQVVPGIDWDQPMVDIPLFVWSELQTERLSDPGSCPYAALEGDATVYKSGCRTNEGYEWTGEVRTEEWEADGWQWRRWEFDLEVVADTDNPSLDRAAIEGAMVYVVAEEEGFDRGIQANIRVELDGYWERATAQDPREDAWTTLAYTGRDESDTEAQHRLDVDGELAGVGSFRLASDNLTVGSCGVTPTGTADLSGSADSTLRFGDTCARCVAWEGAGANAEQACGG